MIIKADIEKLRRQLKDYGLTVAKSESNKLNVGRNAEATMMLIERHWRDGAIQRPAVRDPDYL